MKVVSLINDEILFEGNLEECKAYIVKMFTLQETLDLDIDISSDNGFLVSYVLEWE